ncbi:hypothetical protein ZWY2020_058184 [Hordeum vulgare]|nr:hypothetical protein ZWY2020_058184 [Hordeum vulgare]
MDPAEFLQLYTLSIRAAGRGDKVMACWFPMALKGGALSWLLNLPKASITSWDSLHERFITNFHGTRDRAPTMNDLRRIKQQEGETLHKFIQHIKVMRLKIPKASDEAVISSLSDGVTDLKMKEELTMSDEMSTAPEMFNLANKCAWAEEGRQSLLGPQAAETEEKKADAKEAKRKAPAVLTAVPEAKYSRGGEHTSGGALRASSMAPTAMIPPSAKSSTWSMPSTSARAPDVSTEAPMVAAVRVPG